MIRVSTLTCLVSPLDGLQGGIMKKKILAMTLLLAIMASMLVFVACKDDEPDEPKKLLGGFLSPEQSEGNSIIAPFASCAYESD